LQADNNDEEDDETMDHSYFWHPTKRYLWQTQVISGDVSPFSGLEL